MNKPNQILNENKRRIDERLEAGMALLRRTYRVTACPVDPVLSAPVIGGRPHHAQRYDIEGVGNLLVMTVKEAEANAKIAVAKAEGNAKAMKIKADAEAYYNRTIAASLSPMIVQEDLIEKWDGKMPQIMGGNGMMLDVSKIVGNAK